jgi:hypothetical protein
MIYHCIDCQVKFYKLEIAHRGHEVQVELEDDEEQ